MDRYWKSNTAANAPITPDTNAGGFPQDEMPSSDVKGTVPGAWWYHSVNEEIRGAIAKLGGVPDWTRTDQLGAGIADALSSAKLRLSSENGSTQVGFLQAGDGATPRTVQDKLRDVIHVKDFGAVGGGVVDDTLAIRKAIAALPSSNAVLDFGGDTYLVTNAHGLQSALNSPAASYALVIEGLSNIALVGHGARIVATVQPTDMVTMAISGCSNIELRGITFDGLNHYEKDSVISYKQQLLHLLNPHGAWIHHCRFANSANIGLLVTAQYQVIAPTKFPSSNMVEIASCIFDNVLQNSTYGTGIDVLNVHHCVFKNPVCAAWKMSSTADTRATPNGDVGHFKDVIWDSNIVFFDSGYANPLAATGGVPNNYRVMLDGVSFAKQYKITNSIFDNGGAWDDGITTGGFGLKIEPTSGDESCIAKPNTRVDVSGNKFFDVSAKYAVAVSISPFVDDAVLQANEFHGCYHGIDVNNGSVTLAKNYPDVSRSRFSIRSNEFFGTLNREIAFVSFFGDEISITDNRASLKGQPRGTAQLIYVSAIGSTLSRLVVSRNQGDRNIGITANAREWEIDDNSCGSDTTCGLSVGAKVITQGSRAFVRRNRVDSPQGARIDGIAGPGGWVEFNDNTLFNCSTGAWYATRLGDGTNLIGVFRRNVMASGSVSGDTKYNVQGSRLVIDVEDTSAPDTYPRLSSTAVNGSTYRVVGTSSATGLAFIRAAGIWVTMV
ncbi:hypothetical protein [Caballeronia glebae]|uniref:hypothetical protein n=1 Tax=Caballeronia glebae TaxID=1777143 RepID=UPI0038B987B5